MLPENHAVARTLRAGKPVRDGVFDQVYPDDVRRVSARFWTPVDVALTASRWLTSIGAHSVLDIGSGAGKFCIVTSLASGQNLASVTGVEQREQLIDAAKAANTHYEAKAQYLHGTIESIDPGPYDAFYLFNPFGENLYAPDEQFDTGPALSALRYLHDLSIFEHWLDSAPAQTAFLTYHGFGGRIPNNYTLLKAQNKGSDQLRLWRKTRAGSADSFTLETDAVHAPEVQSLPVRVARKR
ncbi:MAG: ribosomal protein methyltransferase [Pseudomonadota bacterium]